MANTSESLKVKQELESGDRKKVDSLPRSINRPFNSSKVLESMSYGEFNRPCFSERRRVLFEESPSVTDLMMIRDEKNCHQDVKVVYSRPGDSEIDEDESKEETFQ